MTIEGQVRPTRWVSILATIAIGLAACSGGSPSGSTPVGSAATGASSPSADGPTLFPDARNTEVPLESGTYATSTMADPVLTMTLPGRWTFFDQGPTNLQINRGLGAHLESNLSVFDFFGRVVDPADDHTIVKTNDLISWLEHNPHIRVVGHASSVRIGGIQGREIDFRTIGAPPCAYVTDGSRCWNLMPIIDGDPFAPANAELGTMFVVGSAPSSPNIPFRYRLAVAELADHQVVFAWQEAASAFGRTVKTFEEVLSSVRAS